MFDFNEALRNARRLHSLAIRFNLSYGLSYRASRWRAFGRFEGEHKDWAVARSDDLDGRLDSTVEGLKEAADAWVRKWAREVDAYNRSVYDEELRRTQADLDVHWDSVRASMRKDGGLLNHFSAGIGFNLVKTVDALGVNVLDDDATDVVEIPKIIEDDTSLWPIKPGFILTEPVFVYYSGSSLSNRNAYYQSVPS